MISIHFILIISSLVFSMGLIGIVINKNNLLSLLMSIELILLAVNTNFIAFSYYLHDISGQIFVLFILAVAAAEAAIGLAILILVFRHKKAILADELNNLSG